MIRSQLFEYLREPFYKHALEHLEVACPKKQLVIFFSSYSKCLSIIDLLKVCDWSGHIFGASASPRSLTKKNWLCHPLALFMAVSMIPNMWHSSCYWMRHSWLTKFGFLRLNQLVYIPSMYIPGTAYQYGLKKLARQVLQYPAYPI